MKRPKRYGKDDPEISDPTPIEMPLGYMRPTPIHELIARMVRQAVQLEKDEPFETEEEADDFEPEDEELLNMTPYTLTELQEQEPFTQEEPEPEPLPAKPEPDPPTGDPPDPHEEEPS